MLAQVIVYHNAKNYEFRDRDPNFHGWWLEEDFRTDKNGFVSFPERDAWRNILLAIGSPIWNLVLFGKTTYDVMAFGWGSYSRGEVYCRNGPVLPESW